MTNILALDTSTDACSVAVSIAGEVQERYAVLPRQHSHLLLAMLEELVPGGDLRAAGIDLLAYGAGPGSFTGLRIAASAAQGMAFAAALPAVAVSSLACQALTALRQGLVVEGDCVLSLMDARIDECYWALFEMGDGLPHTLLSSAVAKPEHIPVTQILARGSGRPIHAIGDGLLYCTRFPQELELKLPPGADKILPHAADLLRLAETIYREGATQRAHEISPSYIQERIGWKKLAEPGKRE